HADGSDRRSTGDGAGTRDAGRRRARNAVHGDRHRRVAVSADRVGALGLLPARRRIRSEGSRRQTAFDSRGGAAARRDRAVASAAYMIGDQNGKLVDNRAFDMRLLPIMSGVPSALQYSAGASLPPGDYTLKLAVVEGGRVGSIEHTIHATLGQASGMTLSELMVGGPIEVGELLQ